MSEVPVAAVEALFSETTGDAVRQFPEMAEKYGGSAGKKISSLTLSCARG